jgi:hypothetical protein
MHAFDDEVTAAARAAREAARPEPGGPAARQAPDTAAVLHLQRTAGNAGVARLMASDEDPHGIGRLAGGAGSPLPEPTRVQMESAIGADFSSVRVHTGGDADASARSLGAHAYTAGEDIVFASGRYDPGSPTGQRTLAHELTHVVQQRRGPVDGTDNGNGVQVSDPSDRFEREAEASADRVMAGHAATGADDHGPATATGVQREAAEDEPAESPVAEEPADDVLSDEPVADEPAGEEPAAEETEQETVAQGLFVQGEESGHMDEAPEDGAG